jgi:hypothetical protein
MIFNPASTGSLIGFIVLIACIFAFYVWGISRTEPIFLKKMISILIIWNTVTSLIVLSGIIEKNFIPFGIILFLMVNVSAFIFALRPIGQSLQNLPVWILILFQSFRLPLELIMHSWSETQTMPVTMSWNGQNFDILTGIFAILAIIPALRNSKIFHWSFNILGIAMLLNVFRVVLMSSPLPFAWPLANPVQLIAHFPYHMIATVCVWSALIGHILLTKKLLKATDAA